MTSFFGGFAGAPVEVEIKLQGEAERKQVEVKGEKDKKEMCPVFYDGESVIGQVSTFGRGLMGGQRESQGWKEVSARWDKDRDGGVNR
jgi:hypothetical protein